MTRGNHLHQSYVRPGAAAAAGPAIGRQGKYSSDEVVGRAHHASNPPLGGFFCADCVGQPTQKPTVRIGVSSVAAADVGPPLRCVVLCRLTAGGSLLGEQT